MPDPNVIEFECPRCLENIRASKDDAGQRIECPSCQGSLLVPSQSISQELFDDIFESKTTEPESPEPISSPPDPPSDEADEEPPIPGEESPVLDEQDLLEDEDLLEGIDILPDETGGNEANPLEAKNPFEVDPDAPIKVDGIGDLYSHADVYGINCKVCETRIHVRPEQVDTHVECPECFSQVLVTPRITDKPSQRWVKEGWGKFAKTESDSDDEMRLSDPIERPKIEDINEAYGLEPVTDDLLAPKPKSVEPKKSPLETADEPPEPPLLEIIDEAPEPSHESRDDESEIPSLEIMEDEPEPLAGSEPDSNVAPLPNVAGKKPAAQRPEKSRREAYEESQRRQLAAESGTVYTPPDDETEETDFPEFDFVSLLNAVKEMLQNPGVIVRACIAIALMSLGTILMQWIWPSFVPTPEGGEDVVVKTLLELLLLWLQWGVIGGVPYLIGLATLWFTCGYIFRDAALGQRRVLSWKNTGIAEIKATFLLFSFGFFIGGLPMPPVKPFLYLILPLRFLLGSLFLLSAWYSQGAFSILNIDAFKNVKKHMSQWVQYYSFILALAAIGFVAGMIFWMRGVIPIFAGTVFVSVIAVSLTVVVTLAFAAVCGWHCGRVVEALEKSE